MSLRNPVCIRRSPRWLLDSAHPRSELKRRFFACFPPTPGPIPTQSASSQSAGPSQAATQATPVRRIDSRSTIIKSDKIEDAFPTWSSEQAERDDGLPPRRSGQELELEESVVRSAAGCIRAWQVSADFERYKRFRNRLYLALTRPRDNPDYQNVHKVARSAPRDVSYYFEHYGESAYDWRPALEMLMDTTQPFTPKEATRLYDAFNSKLFLHSNTMIQETESRMAHAFIHNGRAPHSDSQDTYPAVKTPQSFAKYILTVASVKSPLPQTHARINQTASGARPKITRDLLHGALYDPQNRPLLTYEAFNTAIQFLQVAGEVQDVHQLVSYMSEIGLEPTIDIYNCMFHEMARKKNLSSFTALLARITRKGLCPDVITWCNFLACLDSRVVQELVMKEMQKLALFAYAPAPSFVATSLVRQDAGDFLREGESVWQYLKNQESKWNNNWRWLTSRVVDELLGELAFEGRLYELASVFAMRSYSTAVGKKPNEWTLVRLLQLCRGLGQAQGAVEVLWFFQNIGIETNRLAMEALFKVFLENGYTNCCRVVWQIACARGLNFAKIKRPLTRALMTPPHCVAEPLKDRLSIFRAYASKAIAGRGISHNWKIYWDDWLYYDKPEYRERMMFHVQAVLVQSDTDLHAPMVYKGNMAEDLKRAFEQDLEWQGRPEMLRGDIDWMRANAYNVQFYESSEQANRAQRAKAMEAMLAYEEDRNRERHRRDWGPS